MKPVAHPWNVPAAGDRSPASRSVKRLHPALAIMFLLPVVSSCGLPTGQGYGGPSTSCTVPAMAGSVVHVELADSGGGMMAGGGMQGSGPGAGAGGSGRMMLRTDTQSVAGGQPVSFIARNNGSLVHELIVLQMAAGTAPGSMAIGADQKVSESAIRAEASKPCGAGAGSGLAQGATGWVTITLAPGDYALVCNLPGHYAAGMWADFAVK